MSAYMILFRIKDFTYIWKNVKKELFGGFCLTLVS